MRSRTIREGSVGLLIVAGLAVFGGLVVWISGISLGRKSYKFIVNFGNAAGMQVGASVSYRGVQVGRITNIEPGTNGVNVTVEIDDPGLLIPRNVQIEANQSGLIGATNVDILPLGQLPATAQSLTPFGAQCNSSLVICEEDQINGDVGSTFADLLRNGNRIAELYADPAFFDKINSLAENASNAARDVSELSKEMTQLSRIVRQEVAGLSKATNAVTSAANQTSSLIGFATGSISSTSQQYSQTARELNQLITSANQLLVSNRGNLVSTLDSISQASQDLRVLTSNLTVTANRVNSAVYQTDVSQMLRNLENLSANAAQASANLRDVSNTLNNPTNLLVLQQTLDSARVTFENAQKITADLDDLTGDPAFRRNVKDLVNGLSGLVSSTEQLQQQALISQQLEALNTSIETASSNDLPKTLPIPKSPPKIDPPKIDRIAPADQNVKPTQEKQMFKLLPPAPRKSVK